MRAALLALPLLWACSDPESAMSPGDDAAASARAAPTHDPAPAGTPCPASAAREAQAKGVTFGSRAGLNGVTFERQSGSSSCRMDDGGDIVCDMRAPGMVRVTGAFGGGETYFDIPAGRDARVSMSHDIARCVLN